jgi:hypothetical protein
VLADLGQLETKKKNEKVARFAGLRQWPVVMEMRVFFLFSSILFFSTTSVNGRKIIICEVNTA